MGTYTATSRVHARLEGGGSVKVDAGQDVPSDVLPDEIARLAAAGLLVESTSEPDGDAPPSTSSGDASSSSQDPVPPPKTRGKPRGQSGPTEGDQGA